MAEDDLLAPDDEAPVEDEAPDSQTADDERRDGIEGAEHLGLTPPD